MRRVLVFLPILLFACAGKKADANAPADPCAGEGPRCIGFTAGVTTEGQIQQAFVRAKSGDVFVFSKGTFPFTNTLGLVQDEVTVKGKGADETILDFKGQKAGSEGLFVTASGFTIESLTVRDTKGDGIKVEGGDRVTFRKVKALWTAGAGNKSNGAYGLYPVQCKNVLIEESYVSGASDAGIYVGQSEKIIVRKSHAENNVAGIEIENSYEADVYDNVSTHNTAGILVFDLPGLPKKGGNTVRVFKNQVKLNDVPNFAPAGNIVGKVPKGTGMLIMANHDVEVFDNDLDGNGTMHIGVVSYHVAQDEGFEAKDPAYYPYPAAVYVHDNKVSNGGLDPDVRNEIGNVLKTSINTFPDKHVPDVVYDGILDSKRTSTKGTPNPMDICVKNAGTFADLRAETGGPGKGFPDMKTDVTPFTCTLPPLPAVKVTGVP